MTGPIEGRTRELLEAPNFASVATLREDGSPAVNVTWVDVDGDHVVLNSAEGRAWPRNLRRDPRVTIAVINAENPYEYAQIRGRVVEETHEGAPTRTSTRWPRSTSARTPIPSAAPASSG